jgi:ribonuclease VapC
MVVDTSAWLAVLEGEPDAQRLVPALADAEAIRVSAGTLVEAGIVVVARRAAASSTCFSTACAPTS